MKQLILCLMCSTAVAGTNDVTNANVYWDTNMTDGDILWLTNKYEPAFCEFHNITFTNIDTYMGLDFQHPSNIEINFHYKPFVTFDTNNRECPWKVTFTNATNK